MKFQNVNPCTLRKMTVKRRVDYWAIRLFVLSHRSLVRLLHTVPCAHSLACSIPLAALAYSLRSFARSLPSSWGRGFCPWSCWFHLVSTYWATSQFTPCCHSCSLSPLSACQFTFTNDTSIVEVDAKRPKNLKYDGFVFFFKITPTGNAEYQSGLGIVPYSPSFKPP